MEQNENRGLLATVIDLVTDLVMKRQRDHIEKLLKENDLVAVYYEDSNYHALPYDGKVWLPPINTNTDYFIALHEIGHCLADGDPEFNKQTIEIQAWIWAFENSIINPSQKVKTFVEECLASYGVYIKI